MLARHIQVALGVVAIFACHISGRRINLTQHGGGNLPECSSIDDRAALYITPDCFDPDYATAIIDNEDDQDLPIQHRRVHGHFEASGDKFNLYLPPKSLWDGKFFQLVYPTQNSSATDYAIGFGVDSGGYTVQMESFGYRGNAAVAKLSRQIAHDYYGETNRTIYGYVYGGSGGSLQTVGAVENTNRVWDGAVILIQAVPFSNPNNWSIRALSGLVLSEEEHKVVDAIRPGGTGDPFSGLPAFKRAVLDESTALGVPLRAWENFEGTGRHRTQLLDVLENLVIPQLKAQDPSYADDFWDRLGYLGSEKSELGDFFRQNLIDSKITVSGVGHDTDGYPTSILLVDVPAALDGLPGLEVTLPSLDGVEEESFFGRFSTETKSITTPTGINATWISSLAPNSTLKVDNRWWLAVHTLHRHQVPTQNMGMYGYGFLRDDEGKPIYPQRDVLLGPGISQGASGGAIHSGNITSKVIAMDTLLDADAFPWHADWYKKQIARSLGDDFDDNYRLYFTDNADHQMEFVSGPRSSHIVDFIGTYEQHLRDLWMWVERGIKPPEPTNYTVVNGQINVPPFADERHGIQPTVVTTVNGCDSTEAEVGQTIEFFVHAEVPASTGTITSLEWDFYGNGTYTAMDVGTKTRILDLRIKHSYDRAGTFYPSVRVTSHRDGDRETTFALVKNLARARVTAL